MPDNLDITVRPRRLRLRAELRDMLKRVTVRRSDIIVPIFAIEGVGSSRVDLQACKLEYSIVSPK